MEGYFKAIALAASPVVEPRRFLKALMECAKAMSLNRSTGLTNSQVFWQRFRALLPEDHQALVPLLDSFYANEYKELASLATYSSLGKEIVQAALDRGMRLVLATNPFFPRVAIEERMAWAKVANFPWELITDYEEMHSCKPYPEYYLEIAQRLGLSSKDCLMVGNDVPNDLAATKTGMRVCLVTDFLINPKRVDYEELAYWHGTLEELLSWFRNTV